MTKAKVQSFSVKTSDGRQRKVYAFKDWVADSRFAGFPPHTSRMEPIATISRDENFYGSLDAELYVVLDHPSEATCFVMWIGYDGSQYDDDVSRLDVVGWWPYPDADEEEPDNDEGPAFLKPAAEALLYVYFRFLAANGFIDGFIDESDTIECAEEGVLTDESVSAILAQVVHEMSE